MKARKLLPDLLLLLSLFGTHGEVTQAVAKDLGSIATNEDSRTSWPDWAGNWWSSLWGSTDGSDFMREAKPPVRQEIVDEIKAKTSKWKAKDPAKNPMRKVPGHLVQSTLGNLGRDQHDGAIYRIDFARFITEPMKLLHKALALSEDVLDQLSGTANSVFSHESA